MTGLLKYDQDRFSKKSFSRALVREHILDDEKACNHNTVIGGTRAEATLDLCISVIAYHAKLHRFIRQTVYGWLGLTALSTQTGHGHTVPCQTVYDCTKRDIQED